MVTGKVKNAGAFGKRRKNRNKQIKICPVNIIDKNFFRNFKKVIDKKQKIW